MTVKERIKVFAKSQERSVRAFEIKCGLNIGYVNAIRISIQPDKIQSIASHYPNLNIDWLLTGEGEMIKGEKKVYDVSAYDMPENIIKAPLIGQYANGGYLRGFADPVYLEEQPVFYSTRKHTNETMNAIGDGTLV